ERYISRPRHVEFQVLADSYGHTVHVLERECSVQRRHQKIVEETPSPALTPSLRHRMGEAAVALAKAAGYVNAGTVEFLLDENEDFYFLEMNTRLQVEHPITEAVTGLDLVEWQARIAAGKPLTLRQEDIRHQGHAIECRIYAEDPYSGFLPSTGTLLHWQPPSGPGLRLDSGVGAGQQISPYYDPMLAKLVAWGADRHSSLRRMEEALRRFAALGVITNISFLRDVVSHTRFREGIYDTGFLEEHPELLVSRVAKDVKGMARALAAHLIEAGGPSASRGERGHTTRAAEESDADGSSPWRLAGRWRLP
ncbi:MAG: acetyl-CoA carboxylase biotin carboxylase subunit, partial [Chloroflexi bacterium]|nr:acetyl-CoA carboxylase biotin carboxylase subunit [Chloroflexota bacterium]